MDLLCNISNHILRFYHESIPDPLRTVTSMAEEACDYSMVVSFTTA
jgi:hypothetical protein